MSQEEKAILAMQETKTVRDEVYEAFKNEPATKELIDTFTAIDRFIQEEEGCLTKYLAQR